MSVTFVVLSPTIAASWPLITTAAAAAASALGLHEHRMAVDAEQLRSVTELEVENSEVLEGAIAREERITFVGNGVRFTLFRDVRGTLKVHAEGDMPPHRLEQAAKAMIGRVRQQIAYHQLLSTMMARGFVIDTEQEVDGRIRLVLRRFE